MRLYKVIVFIKMPSINLKILLLYSFILHLTLFLNRGEAIQYKQYSVIRIKQNSVLYKVKTIDIIKEESIELPLSNNLVIPSKYYGSDEPLNISSSDLTFLSLELLRKGYVILEKSKSSPVEFIEAEDYAKTQKNGIWAEVTTSNKSNNNSKTQNVGWIEAFNSFLMKGWKYIALFLGSSIVFFLLRDFIKIMIKKLFFERKVQLIFIGVKGCGKTGLFLRFLEPKATKNQITSLETSSRSELKKTKRTIRVGRYEIFPSFHDTPGEEFVKVHDLLLSEKKYSIILVLAPTGKPKVADTSTLFEKSYITEQLHYCKYFVSTILLSGKMKNKPKFIVVFLSKFDLISNNPPYINASIEETKKYHDEFKEHIKLIEVSAKSRDMLVRIIAGSAAEPEWKTAQSILDDSVIDKL